MVKNKNSQVVILSGCNCLSFRDERIKILEQEKKILTDFSSKIRGGEDFKYIIPVSENNGFTFRNIIIEILYISVEKDAGNIFFITDRTGEMYLKKMLSDFHTDYTDMKINFLTHQKEKIHIIPKIPFQRDKNDILIFFRTLDRAEEFIGNNKILGIVTLRDIYRKNCDLNHYINELKEKGWSELQIQQKRNEKDQNDSNSARRCKTTKEICHNPVLTEYYNTIKTKGLDKIPGSNYLDIFSFFYQTISIPLRWYEFYQQENEEQTDFILSMIPSQSIQRIDGINPELRSILLEVLTNIESKLFDSNPKYKKILEILEKYSDNDEKFAIILPNKLLADAFEWSLMSQKGGENAIKNAFSIFYPESLFTKALDDEKHYGQVIFSFVPSPEMIFAAQNLSDCIHFIIYREEDELLDAVFDYANEQNISSWYTSSSKMELVEENILRIPEKSFVEKHPRTRDFSVGYQSSLCDLYSQFISYLSRGDPTEDEKVFANSGFIDERHFIITDEGNNKYELRGWDNVVLFNNKEKTPFRKYLWISPRMIKKSDIIFLVPDDIRHEYLRKEIMDDIGKKKQDYDILINYISKWKYALKLTREKYQFKIIHQKLAEKGLNKNYLTVHKWFDGLLTDPKETAIIAVVDPNYNIGPKNPEDILIFGQTFGHKDLISEYREIFSAMKVFRVNNQHIGGIAMQKMIRDFNDSDIEDKCSRLKVNTIQIKG